MGGGAVQSGDHGDSLRRTLESANTIEPSGIRSDVKHWHFAQLPLDLFFL
jgi:hypothetical protein